MFLQPKRSECSRNCWLWFFWALGSLVLVPDAAIWWCLRTADWGWGRSNEFTGPFLCDVYGTSAYLIICVFLHSFLLCWHAYTFKSLLLYFFLFLHFIEIHSIHYHFKCECAKAGTFEPHQRADLRGGERWDVRVLGAVANDGMLSFWGHGRGPNGGW